MNNKSWGLFVLNCWLGIWLFKVVGNVWMGILRL